MEIRVLEIGGRVSEMLQECPGVEVRKPGPAHPHRGKELENSFVCMWRVQRYLGSWARRRTSVVCSYFCRALRLHWSILSLR